MIAAAGEWPVPVFPNGACAPGTMLFRMAGHLHVTVMVKATFALVPEAPMTLIAPEPLFRDNHYQDLSAARTIVATTDLVPYLPSVDVVLTGHAWPPRGASVARRRVRLAVFRDDALLDKTLEVSGARAGVEPAPLVDFGPLAASPANRDALFGGASRSATLVSDLPADIDWGDLQSAPLDQQIDALCGDEWVVLEGMHREHPQLRSRLPSARGVATLFGHEPGAPDGQRHILLRPDLLRIDADALRCSLVFRGVVQLRDEGVLQTLRFSAGVATEDRPLPPVLPPPLPAPRAPTRPAEVVRPVNVPVSRFEGTMDLTPNDLSVLTRPATPFPERERGGTLAAPARPIEGAPWSHLPPPALPPRPRRHEFESTMEFRTGAIEPLEPPVSPPAPPPVEPPPAPRPAPLEVAPAEAKPVEPAAPAWSWAEPAPAPAREAPQPTPAPRIPTKTAVNKTLYTKFGPPDRKR